MRFLLILCGLALIAGCTVPADPQSTLQEAEARAYKAPGPASITVITMINNRTGSGGHTALMVSGSQRVIFDPAGSFRDPRVAERGDVIFGITPAWERAYKSAHARDTYHVVTQKIDVTDEQAEQALQLVLTNGAVAKSYCTNSTTTLLRQVPGFEDTRVTFFPKHLMEQIAKRGDVTTDKYYENDAGDVLDGVAGKAI